MGSNDVFQTPIHSYLRLPATALAAKIRRLEIGVEELLQVFIERIDVVNASINAVVADRFSEALKEAKEIDEMLSEMSGEEREELEVSKPFLGVPFTVKEAFGVTGLPNSGGLVARKDHIAQEDAVVVHRLRQAGAIPLALSNCSELCMWWESANRVYGRTCNPFDRSKIVGGSSGGEGAIIGAAGSVIGVGSGKKTTGQACTYMCTTVQYLEVVLPKHCRGFFGRNPWGVTPMYELRCMCRCEGYSFQQVYSRIGYRNQRVLV